MAKLELKRSPYLWAYAFALLLILGAAVHFGECTFKQAAGLLLACLAFPGLLGASQYDNETEENDARTHVTLRPPPEVSKITHHEVTDEKESGEHE